MKKVLILLGLVLFLNSCTSNNPIRSGPGWYNYYGFKNHKCHPTENKIFHAVAAGYTLGRCEWGESNKSQKEANMIALDNCNKRVLDKKRYKSYVTQTGYQKEGNCILVEEGNKDVLHKNMKAHNDILRAKGIKDEDLIMDDYGNSNWEKRNKTISTTTSTTTSLTNTINTEEKKIKTCENYGFIKGTEEFGKCIFNLMELELEYTRLEQEQAQSNQSFELLDEQTKLLEKEKKLQRDLEISRRMIELGNILGTPNTSGTINKAQEICFKTSESISGLNKICNYNCPASGGYAMTIRSHQVCSPSTTK